MNRRAANDKDYQILDGRNRPIVDAVAQFMYKGYRVSLRTWGATFSSRLNPVAIFTGDDFKDRLPEDFHCVEDALLHIDSLVGKQTHIGYIIHGSTGCTCCRSDNFIHGLYDTAEAAFAQVEQHVRMRTVRSQYSESGNYTVNEVEYENLSNGRILIDTTVFDSVSFFETGTLAEALRHTGRRVERSVAA